VLYAGAGASSIASVVYLSSVSGRSWGFFDLAGYIAIVQGLTCLANAAVELMTVGYCSRREQIIDYPCYHECCWTIGFDDCSERYRMQYKYTLYQKRDLELIPQSLRVKSSVGVDTRSRPRPEHWCNLFCRNISCGGCGGRCAVDATGRLHRLDTSGDRPTPEQKRVQEELFHRQELEQRALYLRQQPGRHALRDSISEAGMVSLPSGGGGQRQGSAYESWSTEDRDGVTPYEDFTQRPQDPRVRNSINDPHDYSLSAIQHGAVPIAQQTPLERRRSQKEGLSAPGSYSSDGASTSSASRAPRPTPEMHEEAGQLGMDVADYMAMRGEMQREMAGSAAMDARR